MVTSQLFQNLDNLILAGELLNTYLAALHFNARLVSCAGNDLTGQFVLAERAILNDSIVYVQPQAALLDFSEV